MKHISKLNWFRRRSLAVLLLAAATSSLAGCGGRTALGGDPNLSVLPATDMPEPKRADFAVNAAPYYVGPFDRLVIDVYGIEELSKREVQVDAAGRISFPLAGILDVNGRTPGEVEAELSTKLRQAYVKNPQVTVNLKETLSRLVTVEGEVRKPGLYPLVGKLTLMGAIARAEGTTDLSRLDDVVVFRTVDGKRYAALYNLNAIRHGAYQDPMIYANDVVMVGNSESRRVFKDFIALMPALVTPLVIGIDRLTN